MKIDKFEAKELKRAVKMLEKDLVSLKRNEPLLKKIMRFVLSLK